MEEIKVGEYIRDRAGNIAKVMKNHNNMFEIESNTGARINQFKELIVKHSKNIIDLIECGDYVNGQYVEKINQYENGKFITVLTGIIDEQDIETILTKEQYEQNSYRV